MKSFIYKHVIMHLYISTHTFEHLIQRKTPYRTVNVVLINFNKHLSLKWCSCSLNLDTYLVFHVCVIILFFFFWNRWFKIQSLTDLTKVENNQNNIKFYVFVSLFVVSAVSNIVLLYCCIYKRGQWNCETKKRELIIYFTNQV